MMILPQKSDLIHRIWLYKLLSAIFNDAALAKVFRFKGGTCAAMLGYLDRFSVDLDFDYVGTPEEIPGIRSLLEKIFSELGLKIDDDSKKGIQYFLKYENESGKRNSISIDSHFPVPASNIYEPKKFIDIDRIIMCQTKETMFANKLAAIIDRHRKRGSIAGRDIYDIHQFFSKGFDFDAQVLEEHVGMKADEYIQQLITFIEEKVTTTVLDQDLNHLLPPDVFKKVRKNLKLEALLFLKNR